MSIFKLEIKLLSDAIIGSAEGYGAIVDNDIVYDELGIPFIPAKRVKGVLRDSLDELNNHFISSGIKYIFDKELLFGTSGNQTGLLFFSNLYIEEYDKNREWLSYFKSKEGDYKLNISQQKILNTFTSIRTSTTIDKDKGTSKKGSLRKFRSLNSGNKFYCEIEIEEKYVEQFALICQNVRSMGTKRNRGFGSVAFTLFDEKGNNVNKNSLQKLEGDI